MNRAASPVSVCWVCGGALGPFWSSPAFDAVACARCGHIQAAHAPLEREGETDYHLGYDQAEFVSALGATRRRQATVLLDALGALPSPPRSVFDFGCGRGWFLEVARERGLAVAGGDASGLALSLLGESGIAALPLDATEPFEKLDLGALPFIPEVLTFLDVLEHFAGDLAAQVGPCLARLPKAVRYVVIKVPVRDGLLFSLANLARHAGVGSLGQQLFQAGTFPPHQQYFSRRSLAAALSKFGLTPLVTLDDLDFEPDGLVARLSTRSAVRALAAPLGPALGAAIRATRRADSRIVIARRAP